MRKRTYTPSPEVAALLEDKRVRFVAKFGREPRDGDPVFWDEEAPGPEPVQMSEQKLKDQFIVTAAAAGSPPILIWTYMKTGLVPSAKNRNRMSARDRRELSEVQAEFKRTQPDLTPDIEAAAARLVANAYYD